MSQMTLEQAQRNIQVIADYHTNLIADDKGNLSYISWYNVPRWIVQWVRNLFSSSEVFRVYDSVYKTFQKLNEYAQITPIEKRRWTFEVFGPWGGDFDVGYDKVAIGVLADEWNFPTGYIRDTMGQESRVRYELQEAAFKLMRWSSEKRETAKIDYSCDHLYSRSAASLAL